MKKLFLLIAVLGCIWQVASASQNSDTIWTKNIWPEEVQSLLFSMDGSLVFVSTGGQVRIYDTKTGDSNGIVTGVRNFLSYSPDGKFIFTNYPYKLDAQTLKIVASPANKDSSIWKHFSPAPSAALTGDGKYLVMTLPEVYGWTNPWGNIAIASTEDLHIVKDTSLSDVILNVTASPNGRFFVTLSSGFEDWNKLIGRYYRLELWDAQTLKQIKTIYKDSLEVLTIRFTPDSKSLAAAINGQVWFFETQNFIKNKQIPSISGYGIQSFGFSFNYMVTGCNHFTLIPEKIRVWDIESEKLLYEYDNIDYPGGSGVDISPTQQFIISALKNNIALYDFQTSAIINSRNNIDKDSIIGFPNPMDGISKITFDNLLAGNYNIEISDISGVEMFSLFTGFLEIGQHEFTWNTISFNNGVYFCRINGCGVKLMYKFIVLN
jgi:hypothetical protein